MASALVSHLRDVRLRRIPVIDNVEDDRFDALLLLRGAWDVLDEVVRGEGGGEVFACESEGGRRTCRESPVDDGESGSAKVGRVDRVLGETFCPATRRSARARGRRKDATDRNSSFSSRKR